MSHECVHEEVEVAIRDFGVFEERTDTYQLDDRGVFKNTYTGAWDTKDGIRDMKVGDIYCSRCNQYFYEDGVMRIDEGHPKYPQVNSLVTKLNKRMEQYGRQG